MGDRRALAALVVAAVIVVAIAARKKAAPALPLAVYVRRSNLFYGGAGDYTCPREDVVGLPGWCFVDRARAEAVCGADANCGGFITAEA